MTRPRYGPAAWTGTRSTRALGGCGEGDSGNALMVLAPDAWRDDVLGLLDRRLAR